MFLIIKKETNIIVGTANNPVSLEACNKNGQRVVEIEDHEFNIDMIGSKIIEETDE